MLTHIHIKNFIIVKSLLLDFQNGLHVLTGETGAGKSIWIDAIEIGLGGRADAHIIYPGETQCDISLCFSLENQPVAKQWLVEHDLPTDNECIIRRIVDVEKPSRTTINGIPIPQQLVRQFADIVLCIHGQHQHQRLLKTEHQRDLLDMNANNEKLLSDIQTQYEEWKSIDRELTKLQSQAQNKCSDLTLWQYQRDELLALCISENEYEKLFAHYQQLQHAKQFASTLNEAFLLLNGDDNFSAVNQVHQALQRIRMMNIPNGSEAARDRETQTIHNIQTLLQTATINLDEARDELQQYCANIDLSDTELTKIEKRLTTLQDIARKHHIDPTQLSDIIHSLNQKIEQLEKCDDIILTLQEKQKSIVTEYHKKAKELTNSRDKAAKKLSADITEFMQQLGMQGGLFKINLTPIDSPIHFYGNENIRFLIATNPGQTPHELEQIVSGGELSRLSLIIQVLTAEKKNTPTLIFDEVDVGIGGKTADLVGKLLRQLGNHTQVLCVTHLPQVAANGHHHFLAEKITDGKKTSTKITLLDKNKRTEELARMLSGSAITQKSILHAKELLNIN